MSIKAIQNLFILTYFTSYLSLIYSASYEKLIKDYLSLDVIPMHSTLKINDNIPVKINNKIFENIIIKNNFNFNFIPCIWSLASNANFYKNNDNGFRVIIKPLRIDRKNEILFFKETITLNGSVDFKKYFNFSAFLNIGGKEINKDKLLEIVKPSSLIGVFKLNPINFRIFLLEGFFNFGLINGDSSNTNNKIMGINPVVVINPGVKINILNDINFTIMIMNNHNMGTKEENNQIIVEKKPEGVSNKSEDVKITAENLPCQKQNNILKDLFSLEKYKIITIENINTTLIGNKYFPQKYHKNIIYSVTNIDEIIDNLVL